MSLSLQVNNKEYVPSTELAKVVGYTSDYISKLAREERVLGTRVGRQWFVEPESLRTYLKQLEVEKRIAQEDLSRKRKVEHHEKQSAHASVSITKREYLADMMAAGQALAVMVCGVMLGALTLFAFDSGIDGADFMNGVRVAAHDMAAPIKEGLSQLAAVRSSEGESVAKVTVIVEEEPHLEVAAGPQFETAGAYTLFPDLSSVEVAATVVATEVVDTVAKATAVAESVESDVARVMPAVEQSVMAPDISNLDFSDAVELTEEDGEWFVRPVIAGGSEALHPVRELSGPEAEASVFPFVR